jgi:hypothetical protein
LKIGLDRPGIKCKEGRPGKKILVWYTTQSSGISYAIKLNVQCKTRQPSVLNKIIAYTAALHLL